MFIDRTWKHRFDVYYLGLGYPQLGSEATTPNMGVLMFRKGERSIDKRARCKVSQASTNKQILNPCIDRESSRQRKQSAQRTFNRPLCHATQSNIALEDNENCARTDMSQQAGAVPGSVSRCNLFQLVVVLWTCRVKPGFGLIVLPNS